MKPKLLALLCLFFIAAGTNAQPYQSVFGVENTEWRVLVDVTTSTTSAMYDNLLISSVNDTVFNGKLYKKVVVKKSMFLTDDYYQLMREDIKTGSMWYLDPVFDSCRNIDTSEKIAWTMDLKVGDTFDINGMIGYPQYQGGIVPTSMSVVDSVYYDLDNKKHIRFFHKHKNPPFKMEFIEGVGSTGGPFFKRLFCNIGNPFLLCNYKDNSVHYMSKRFSSFSNPCDPYNLLSVTNNQFVNVLILYPNPVTNYVYFDNSKYSIAEYRIFNSFGLTVSYGKFDNTNKVDVSALPTGIYMISLLSNQQVYYSSFTKL